MSREPQPPAAPIPMSGPPPIPPALDGFLREFWQRHMDIAENTREDNLKETTLPLARIKKVMKMDPDVKMISSDAPLLLSKACEIFISEVTSRAWMLAEMNKRRTLQRVDVAGAVGQSDQFDFLVDIVPREYGHIKHKSKKENEDQGTVMDNRLYGEGAGELPEDRMDDQSDRAMEM